MGYVCLARARMGVDPVGERFCSRFLRRAGEPEKSVIGYRDSGKERSGCFDLGFLCRVMSGRVGRAA